MYVLRPESLTTVLACPHLGCSASKTKPEAISSLLPKIQHVTVWNKCCGKNLFRIPPLCMRAPDAVCRWRKVHLCGAVLLYLYPCAPYARRALHVAVPMLLGYTHCPRRNVVVVFPPVLAVVRQNHADRCPVRKRAAGRMQNRDNAAEYAQVTHTLPHCCQTGDCT